MAAIVELPVVLKPKAAADSGSALGAIRQLNVRFPDRCVYCGAPAGGITRARVAFRLARDQDEVATFVQLPYCARHQSTNERITRFNKIAAGIAALAAVAAAIYVASLIKVTYLLKPLIVLVAALPLSIVFLLLWSVLRSLLGRLFSDIRHTGIRRATLGFRVDYSKADHLLRFKFFNTDYAARFATLNKSSAG